MRDTFKMNRREKILCLFLISSFNLIGQYKTINNVFVHKDRKLSKVNFNEYILNFDQSYLNSFSTTDSSIYYNSVNKKLTVKLIDSNKIDIAFEDSSIKIQMIQQNKNESVELPFYIVDSFTRIQQIFYIGGFKFNKYYGDRLLWHLGFTINNKEVVINLHPRTISIFSKPSNRKNFYFGLEMDKFFRAFRISELYSDSSNRVTDSGLLITFDRKKENLVNRVSYFKYRDNKHHNYFYDHAKSPLFIYNRNGKYKKLKKRVKRLY